MIKLYKKASGSKRYWETWDNENGSHTVHWGELGTRGESELVASSFLRSVEKKINNLIREKRLEGYSEPGPEEEAVLLVEFAINGFGDENDLNKRHALEDRMNELLGWTGVGHCDGGSIGSGSMEVCCIVVDFEIAKKVIEEDLRGTVFADYTRIYNENA